MSAAWTKLGATSQLVPMPSTDTFWPVLPNVTVGTTGWAGAAGSWAEAESVKVDGDRGRSARGHGCFQEMTPTAFTRGINLGTVHQDRLFFE